jgi:TonB family protein
MVLLLRFDPQGKTLLSKEDLQRNNFDIFGWLVLVSIVSLVAVAAFEKGNEQQKTADNKSYIEYIKRRIKKHWQPINIVQSDTVARFKVSPYGEISNIEIAKSSGSLVVDEAAREAVKAASPLPDLPPFEEEPLTFALTFHYNKLDGKKSLDSH